MTWRAGPGEGPDGLTWQRADVARGTTAPLRRGTEATWQDACGPRVTQAWHVSYTYIIYYHRVIVHISLFLELANNGNSLPYLTAKLFYISSVWDYVPHSFTFCRWRGGLAGVGSDQSGGDRVDLSPRDRQIKHVRKLGDKWIRSERVPDATWRHEERQIIIKKIGCLSAIQPSILLTLHRTADFHRDRGFI